MYCTLLFSEQSRTNEIIETVDSDGNYYFLTETIPHDLFSGYLCLITWYTFWISESWEIYSDSVDCVILTYVTEWTETVWIDDTCCSYWIGWETITGLWSITLIYSLLRST